MLDALKAAVRTYAARHANPDGLALTPVPGLQMMCVEAPRGELHSVYRPDRPEATPLLHEGIMRELHYWLLSGPHGDALRALADPTSHASRLGAAIAILRAEYRSRIPVERLAAAAGMSLTAFHKHFKRLTSLSPGPYQKRLRLIEARRLMLEEGYPASRAAFEVGYESVSQFTRDYGRLYLAPPKRDVLRFRRPPRKDVARHAMGRAAERQE
ncbi:MAG TPA: helix-turn-helix domain-containing protein [Gammaproteobacteria bacterium]